METKFKLTNVVLYAKGWYKESNDVWEDLKQILELDDYSPFDKDDVYSIMLTAVQNSNIYRWTELKEVLNGINEANCWKFGYYTKNCKWVDESEKYPDYDMKTAFIYYVLSNLRFMETKYWNPKTPKYTKLPKPEHIKIKSVYDFFVKKTYSVLD